MQVIWLDLQALVSQGWYLICHQHSAGWVAIGEKFLKDVLQATSDHLPYVTRIPNLAISMFLEFAGPTVLQATKILASFAQDAPQVNGIIHLHGNVVLKQRAHTFLIVLPTLVLGSPALLSTTKEVPYATKIAVSLVWLDAELELVQLVKQLV
jgi:hypothetical protein